MSRTSTVFPSNFVSRESKRDKSYGLQYARAIWGEHTKNISLFNDQIEIWKDNRRYAEGLQSIDKYKNQLSLLSGDLSWLNLDFSPVNRIAALVDNMEGKLMNQMYKIQCNPIDIVSKTKEDEDRDEMFAAMFAKKNDSDLEPITGIPVYSRNAKIPDTDQEAELYFKMSYKQACSIAMEQALEFVFMNNDFDAYTRKKILRDLIVNKRAAIHRYYDENNNICVKYIDHCKVLTPYSEHDDFRNIPYIAVIENMPIKDIAQITDEFDDEKLAEIAKRYEGAEGNPMFTDVSSYEGYYNSNTGITRPWYNFNIPVLSFYFLSVSKENRVKTTKDNGRIYWDKASDNAAPKSKNKELVSKDVQWLYEGKWIVGSDIVFNYREVKNVPRNKDAGSYSPKAELPIHMVAPNIFDMQNKSLVERAKPHEDQMNLINLKIQQHLIQAKPPGMAINVSALSGIMLGLGKDAATPEDIYRMYSQTGSLVYSDRRDDDSIINGVPIQDLPNGIGADFALLVNAFREQMAIINDVIGYNSAVDASSPDQEAVVGAAKMAIQATNNALRPLYAVHALLIEKVAKSLALMIQDSIEYNEDAFLRAIGAQATETIKYGKKLALHQFAIKVELLPDEEERMDLMNLMALGIENEQLFPSDAILIKQQAKQDVKLASQLLVYLEEKNRKDKMQQAKSQVDYTTQQQIESGRAVAESNMEAASFEAMQKGNLIKLQGFVDDQNAEKAHQRKMKEIVAEGNIDKEVAQITHDNNLRATAFDHAIAPKKEAEVALL